MNISRGCADNSILAFRPPFGRGGYVKIGVWCLISSLVLWGPVKIAAGQSKSATNTTLTIASGSNQVTSAASGTVVTLTATVSAGSTPVTVGQVDFCDASVSSCTDIHLMGTAQLTKAGIAAIKFRPGPGNHSYLARFEGTAGYASSVSGSNHLEVTGPTPSTTFLNYKDTNSPGIYDLTADVYGNNSAAPGGTVSFVDASDNNSVLGSATLGSGKAGINLVLFASPQTDTIPDAIAMADFNGDGIEDLAVTNTAYNATVINILLGNGDGTFNAAPTNPAVAPASGIAVGDFNHDGVPDLAVITADTNLTILLGNGDGTFAASAVNQAVGTSPTWIAVADFNRDGNPDLAVANKGSNDISILLGNGDGTFTTAANQQTGSEPFFVAAADFNHDGIPDLAVLNNNNGQNTLTIFLGNGAGGFTLVTTGPGTGTAADALAVADLNGDGVPDLVVVHSEWTGSFTTQVTTVTVSVMIGNGDGTFKAGSQRSFTAPPLAAAANAVFVGDFNGDGKADLAIAMPSAYPGHTPALISILLGDGTGTFSSPAFSSGTGADPSPLVVGDLNGDGIPDVAAVANRPPGGGDQPAWVNILLTENQSASATATGIALPVATGTNQVMAKYGGDSKYQPSVSSSIALNAGVGNPVVVVTPSSNPAFYGTSETLTAKVTGRGLTPTGTVTFYDGSGQLGPATLSGGMATYVTSAFTVGTHSISASYSGDSNYNSGTSTPFNLTVQKAAPTITVSVVSSNLLTTQALNAAITVSGAAGNPAPQGSVTLTGGGYSSPATTLSGGAANITVPAGALTLGNDTLTIAYTPSAASSTSYTTASQTLTVMVVQVGTAASTVTEKPSPAAITDQQGVSISVSVAGGTGQATPTGTVALASGAYNAAAALANGAAVFNIPAGTLPDGSDTVTATYSGDGTYASSTATSTVTVSLVLMTATAPSPVSAGSSTTATLTLTAGSYAGTMNLSCALSTSPANAQNLPTCGLNPGTATIASGGNATTTATFKTTGSSTAMARPFGDDLWRLGEGGLTLAGLLIFGGRARRNRILAVIASFAIVFAVVMAGCGGHGSHTLPGTTAGSYVFTVTAADATNTKITTTSSITLTVQ